MLAHCHCERPKGAWQSHFSEIAQPAPNCDCFGRCDLAMSEVRGLTPRNDTLLNAIVLVFPAQNHYCIEKLPSLTSVPSAVPSASFNTTLTLQVLLSTAGTVHVYIPGLPVRAVILVHVVPPSTV